MRVIEASSVLNSARTLVKNLLMPEQNDYIRENLNAYYLMIENLSRADKRMDESQKELISYVENANLIKEDIGKNSKVSSYENILEEYLHHLVYYPIKNAWIKFNKFNGRSEEEVDGKKMEVNIIKDESLFLYFVFLELYHSSESLGGIAREQTKRTGKSQTPMVIENNHPPDVPENPATEKLSIPEELVEEHDEFDESI